MISQFLRQVKRQCEIIRLHNLGAMFYISKNTLLTFEGN
jgi:hypothetical protein